MTTAAPAGSRELDDRILRELARWLGGIPDGARDRVADWPDEAWARFRRLVVMQGLGPVLAAQLRVSGRTGVVPTTIRASLQQQEEQNARRVERMHGELAAILRLAAERGIEVVPLKGSALAGMTGVDTRRRPMADLDLLVRPASRGSMGAVLSDLGYRRSRRPRVGPKPETYDLDDGRHVVDREGEHPDNPRPVEVHVEAQRHLWEWLSEDDLTAAIWASASPGQLLGEPAMLPAPGIVFQHLAVHATTGLMRGRGRFIQWLDLAGLAEAGAAPSTWVAPRLAYPSLAMAARALPAIGRAVDLEGLAAEAGSPDAVRRWVRRAPLDGRAGLETGVPRIPPQGRDGAWERWRPSALRLGVAYGTAPLPVALARHGARGARHALRLGRASLVRPVRRLVRRPVRRVLRALGLRRRRAAG